MPKSSQVAAGCDDARLQPLAAEGEPAGTLLTMLTSRPRDALVNIVNNVPARGPRPRALPAGNPYTVSMHWKTMAQS